MFFLEDCHSWPRTLMLIPGTVISLGGQSYSSPRIPISIARDHHCILGKAIPVPEPSIWTQRLSFNTHFKFQLFLCCNVLQWNPCKSFGIPGTHYILWACKPLTLFPMGILSFTGVRPSEVKTPKAGANSIKCVFPNMRRESWVDRRGGRQGERAHPPAALIG